MEADIPAGEELNHGEPTVPRPAASVIVLRGGDDALDVLLLRRNPATRFMGGAWVFPGGALDPGDGRGEAAYRAAAVREVEEEAGLRLPDPAALVKFSRWITPPQYLIRFDTHFFLAAAPPDQEARADGHEMVDLAWHAPAAALAAYRRDELELVFPTLKQLEQLSAFDSVTALLDWATGREIETVEPQVQLTGETARVVLPP
ncbi:MAG TPA: NUDIX hydrolase [Solirubrobacteraceae bacterium]|nr:NUDIX hydrolase [Solirubrobacteraceae bacterium]